VNVYAENVKAALLDKHIRQFVTGRFTMDTKYLPNMDQYFVLNVELAEGVSVKAADRKLILDLVVKKIRRLNAEYNFLYKSIGKKAEPKIEFINWGNTEYFARGVKHKWVKKG
jgi:hypothetical protein